MTLSSILDDIADQGVAVPTASEDTTEVSCFEHLAGLPALIERAKQVDTNLHTHRLLNSVLENGAVSKATALEVFAMLPVLHDESMLLTSATTEHNHRLVLKASAGLFSNPEEAGALVQEVLGMIHKTLESSQGLMALCKHCYTEIDQHLARLAAQAPMVIVENQSVNLLTADMEMIARIDSYALNYPPYEGVIDAKFRVIEDNPLLRTLMEDNGVLVPSGDGVSLQSLAVCLRDKCKLVAEQEQALVQAREYLTHYVVNQDPNTLTDTRVPHVLDTLNQLKQTEKLFVGQGSLASGVMDCLSTLV